MRPNRWLIGIFNTLCLATLAACGGGGGGGSTGADPVPTPAGFAYVANTADDTVSAFTVNSVGLISEIDHQQVPGKKALGVGNQPLSVVIEPTRKFAYVANRADNTVSAFAIDNVTGKLSAIGPAVPAGFYPSFLVVHPSGNFLYVVNFEGETDVNEPGSVMAYGIGPTGLLSTIGTPVETGLGPVSMSINGNGNLAYVINQGSKNVSAYTINPTTGEIAAIPGGLVASGNSPSSVVVDPSPAGKFVYVTNQLDDSISGYSVGISGLLLEIDLNGAGSGTTMSAGDGPVAITFDLAGNFVFVANQASDNISVYRVESSGALTPVAGSPFPAGDLPYFIDVDPTGKFLYAANQLSNNVSIFSIDTNLGALTALGTVTVGLGPSSIATTLLP